MPCVPAIRPLSQSCTSMMRNLSDKLSRVFRNLTGTGFSTGKTENGLSLSARLSPCVCPSRSQRARPLKQPPLRGKSNLEWNLSSILNTHWGERSSPGHQTSSTWIFESRSPWHEHWHRQVQSGSDLFGTHSNTPVNPYRNKANMQSKLALLNFLLCYWSYCEWCFYACYSHTSGMKNKVEKAHEKLQETLTYITRNIRFPLAEWRYCKFDYIFCCMQINLCVCVQKWAILIMLTNHWHDYESILQACLWFVHDCLYMKFKQKKSLQWTKTSSKMTFSVFTCTLLLCF